MQTVFTPSLPVKGDPRNNANWFSSDRFRSWAREVCTLAVLTAYWTIALW